MSNPKTPEDFYDAATLLEPGILRNDNIRELLFVAAEQREALSEVLADYAVLQDLWEDVGRHIEKAAIGYNAPQIVAVFAENRRLRLKAAEQGEQLAEALRQCAFVRERINDLIVERDEARTALAQEVKQIRVLQKGTAE